MKSRKINLGKKNDIGIKYKKGALVTFLEIPNDLNTYFKSKMKMPEDWIFNVNMEIELCAVNEKKEGLLPSLFIVEQAEEGKELILRFLKLSQNNSTFKSKN